MKTLIVFYKTKDLEDSEWVDRYDYLTFNSERETAGYLLRSLEIGWRQGYYDYKLTNTTIG